ncbi:MAG TPA: protein kinase [Thermoanaerobaculia bacterium]|nr:protein kinase [Thermoanaerobaculia bacterium]
MAKKKTPPPPPQSALPLSDEAKLPPPNFLQLLADPIVTLPLPRGFSAADEAAHLEALWGHTPLRSYSFDRFVHAGGSGMVFKVHARDETAPLALKIARQKLYSGQIRNPNVAQSLSPVAPQELRALRRLSHSNIVRLYDALADDRGVFSIATSYVSDPSPLDEYLLSTLERHPDPRGRKGILPFAPERLDRACAFLVDRFREIISAVEHMHEQRLYHCDLKPANILVDQTQHAILTDLGSCVHPDDADAEGRLRIQFTWTYAHPELTSLVSDPAGISGGGLKASARASVDYGLTRFDLFALGRTIQEMLAHLVREFGERCYATYNFRFLHLVAALLLDGRNAALKEKIRGQDGRHFVKDTALDFPVDLFAAKRLESASETAECLRRFGRTDWHRQAVPELDPWQPDIINTGIDTVAPFSKRVAEIFRHPVVRRLRSELQLGWMREVYPGATHTRWSHSLGVFAAAADYYSAVLADPEVPAARVLLQPADIEHGLVAALLHDIGQTAFGHDVEAAAPGLYDHESLVARLLDETSWGEPSLRKLIKLSWPRVDLARVLAILGYRETDDADEEAHELVNPVDGIARDIINGPIDADKLDYLVRDAASCRVTYGLSIDRQRFLRALTVDAKDVLGHPRLAIAYRAKGSAAIESLLLARYQMYGAVYWHHTFRCIQAMFTHAVAATFGDLTLPRVTLRKHPIDVAALRELFYYRVVCGHTLLRCRELLRTRPLPATFFADTPSEFVGERALEFVWKFAEDPIRELVSRLAHRKLYRRVFELRTGDLREHGNYEAIASTLTADRRVALGDKLTDRFLDAIYKKMQQRGPIESVSETEARRRHGELQKHGFPLVVIDYPTRGVPEEKNFPRAVGDPARKYIAGRGGDVGAGRGVFHTVRSLQVGIAAVRVFAARELHELVIRYLDPQDVQDCVESVLPVIKVET